MAIGGRTIEEGMRVLAADGHFVGTVVRTAADGAFEVEHGFFFPRDGMVDALATARVDDEGVHLQATRHELLAEWEAEEQRGDAMLPGRKQLPREDEGLIAARLDVPYEPKRFNEPPGEPPLPPDAIDFGESRESLDLSFRDTDDAGLDEDPFGPAPSSDGDRYHF
jgi:hypothetical protein